MLTGCWEYSEQCLSLPLTEVVVVRSLEIIVKYIDHNGVEVEETHQGMVARIIQHEVDHLEGKLIIDY